MEKHKCKLCFKTFMNGKALGGHMSRSHFTNLPLPPKTPQKQEESFTEPLVGLTESTSSEFSSEGKESEVKGSDSGFKDDPKKRFKVMDHEFLDARSVMQQDRESETEPTRKPTRRRSKRARRMVVENVGSKHDQELLKKDLLVKPSSGESLTELETVSSVVVSDEDVALCLLMLSRDSWRSDDSVELKLSQTRGKHQCVTCNKVFKSSQALGSHRIIHGKATKKLLSEDINVAVMKPRRVSNRNIKEDDHQKLHECPFCGKVFRSGQALGGHKRSHFMGTSTTTTTTPTASCSSSRIGDSLVDSNSAKFQADAPPIDLNLPAPMDDDDLSAQLEVSAVSRC